MLAEILHKVAGMERKEYKYRIRPSMASPEIEELGYKGRCKRQMVYNALDFPTDNISDRMEMAMDDSKWHEELSADFIRQTAYKLRDSQTEIDCGFFDKGKIDGILTDILGKDYLFEHKALNHFSFAKYNNDDLPIDYITQCCVYLNQELRDYDINQALLLVKNKNTAQYLEFLIEYDKEKDTAKILYKQNSIDQKKVDLNIEIANILKRAREKFEFVEICKNERRLPKRDYNMSDWQCLDANALIWLANGRIKEISKLKKGEKIKSIDGVTTIKKVDFRNINKQWVRVKPIGLLNIECTDDHLWLVGEWDTLYKWQKGESFIPEYIKAGDLIKYKNKYISVLVPIHKPFLRQTLLTELECEFLGYYAAEGCLGNWQNNRYYRVCFSLHEKEIELAEKIAQLTVELFDAKTSNKVIIDKRTGWKSRRVEISSTKAVEFIRSHIQGKAITKELSPSIMGASLPCLKIFLESAIKGDGCFNKKQKATILSTSSKKLCLQYQQIAWRLGIPAIAQYANKPTIKFGYQASQGYRIQFQGEKHGIKFINIGSTTYAITRIKTVEEIEHNDECWDIEVDSLYHNFTTSSGIVHNCGYCNWKGICWSAYEEEFKELATDAELSNDLNERLAYYLETNLHLLEMKKEHEKLKDEIRQIMIERQAKMATTDEYAVILSLTKSKRIDKDKIPVEILESVLTETISERLTIRKRKEVK